MSKSLREQCPNCQTPEERERLAKSTRCPTCNAQPHFSCRAATVKVTYLKRCHKARVDAAVQAWEDGEQLWNEAIDWLLNSRHTADPDIQKAFWGMVDGRYTRDQADRGQLGDSGDGDD